MTIKKAVGLGIIGGILFGLAIVGGGCSTMHESSAYYYPNWLPDGRIVCWKVTSSWSEALWGRKEEGDKFYVSVMDIDGNNERNLFETTFGSYAEIVASPVGEKIAVYSPGYSEGIWIYDYSGSKTAILSGINIQSADWSPDGTKVAYTASNKLYVINADGTGNTMIAASSETVSWRVGERIAFDGDWVDVISADGTNRVTLVSNSWLPQKKSADEVIYQGADGIYQIKIDGTNNVKLFSDYDHSTLKLSFDNAKIVGGDLITGGGGRIGGIWVTNISDGISKRIR